MTPTAREARRWSGPIYPRHSASAVRASTRRCSSRKIPAAICAIRTHMSIEIEDEVNWLRHRVVRMRTILRYAKDPRAEAGLRELIGDAEARLIALEAKRPAVSA
jgi:hypothetical protein